MVIGRSHGTSGGTRALGAHQVARIFRMQVQRWSIGDAQHHHVVARARNNPYCLAATALRADAHGRLDAAASGRNGRLGLARDDEGDVFRLRCHCQTPVKRCRDVARCPHRARLTPLVRP